MKLRPVNPAGGCMGGGGGAGCTCVCACGACLYCLTSGRQSDPWPMMTQAAPRGWPSRPNRRRPLPAADIFSVIGVYPGWQPASLPAVPGLEGEPPRPPPPPPPSRLLASQMSQVSFRMHSSCSAPQRTYSNSSAALKGGGGARMNLWARPPTPPPPPPPKANTARTRQAPPATRTAHRAREGQGKQVEQAAGQDGRKAAAGPVAAAWAGARAGGRVVGRPGAWQCVVHYHPATPLHMRSRRPRRLCRAHARPAPPRAAAHW